MSISKKMKLEAYRGIYRAYDSTVTIIPAGTLWSDGEPEEGVVGVDGVVGELLGPPPAA